MGFLTLREVKNKNLISVLDGSFSISNTYQRDFIMVISIALVCFSMSEEIGKELKVNEKWKTWINLYDQMFVVIFIFIFCHIVFDLVTFYSKAQLFLCDLLRIMYYCELSLSFLLQLYYGSIMHAICTIWDFIAKASNILSVMSPQTS